MRVIKSLLKRYTKLYKTYQEVESVFEEPELRFQCGLWKNDYNLPVWRRGNSINLFSKEIVLPMWLSFYVFNYKEYVKSKWDYWSFEYRPQFTIVLFGFSFTWTLLPPGSSARCSDEDFYWEAIYDFMDTGKDVNVQDKLKYSTSVVTGYELTPANQKKRDKLWAQVSKCLDTDESKKLNKKIGALYIQTAALTIKPEFIRKEYRKDLEAVEDYYKSLKEYKNSYWLNSTKK